MLTHFSTADGLIALVTLTLLEIVLGIDNVIFISILAGKLPPAEQDRARRIGLMAAMVMRILLLLSITWIMQLTAPLFTVRFNHELSGRDLILAGGGLFLLFKATREIHEKLEGEDGHVTARVAPSLAAVVGQIMVLDIVFSLDSVITAVGMAEDVVGHDRRGRHRGRDHAVCVQVGQPIRRRASDRQGTGAQLPAADRRAR